MKEFVTLGGVNNILCQQHIVSYLSIVSLWRYVELDTLLPTLILQTLDDTLTVMKVHYRTSSTTALFTRNTTNTTMITQSMDSKRTQQRVHYKLLLM